MTGRTRNDIEARVDAIVDSVATVTGWGERNGRALNLISQAAKSVIELAMVLPHDLQPTIFQITTLLSDPDWSDAVVPYLSPPLRAFWRTRFGLLDTNATTPVTNLIDRLRNSRSGTARRSPASTSPGNGDARSTPSSTSSRSTTTRPSRRCWSSSASSRSRATCSTRIPEGCATTPGQV